ncbi:hypothetical protein AVEN_65640-1 [Araneus ventricosus]|uniref:Uncharacterized protein n=1 Tax=Araneus ventricosus TaxID=182803 RepID=A0A4Y2J2I4_ARAVE|nr:hypothetical protein AVEN_65640-1 [Araneus ventricosus]
MTRTTPTGVVFWNNPRNFEPWAEDKDYTDADTPFPNIHKVPKGGCLTLDIRFSTHQAHIHKGSLVQSGFESGTHWSHVRDLISKTPRLLGKIQESDSFRMTQFIFGFLVESCHYRIMGV